MQLFAEDEQAFVTPACWILMQWNIKKSKMISISELEQR